MENWISLTLLLYTPLPCRHNAVKFKREFSTVDNMILIVSVFFLHLPSINAQRIERDRVKIDSSKYLLELRMLVRTEEKGAENNREKEEEKFNASWIFETNEILIIY